MHQRFYQQQEQEQQQQQQQQPTSKLGVCSFICFSSSAIVLPISLDDSRVRCLRVFIAVTDAE